MSFFADWENLPFALRGKGLRNTKDTACSLASAITRFSDILLIKLRFCKTNIVTNQLMFLLISQKVIITFTAKVCILERTWTVRYDQPLFFFSPSATVKPKQHKRKTPHMVMRPAKLNVFTTKPLAVLVISEVSLYTNRQQTKNS